MSEENSLRHLGESVILPFDELKDTSLKIPTTFRVLG
jgi:hypothetical protein